MSYTYLSAENVSEPGLNVQVGNNDNGQNHWRHARLKCGTCILISLLLTACSSQPIVRVQYVPTKIYLAIPAELTFPVTVDLTGMTYGEGLGSLRAALDRCDGQLAAISTLKPPPSLEPY